jgi:hypothetical protein
MSKRLIIGISVALVLIGAVVLTVLLVRSRSLTDETPIDGGTTTDGGTSTGGLGGTAVVPGGSTQGGQGTTATPTTPQAGPCGDGVCSEGESPWCKPDCGNKEERFLGSIKGTVSGTTITIAWATEAPSTGEVKYGKTSSYELGTLRSSTAATTHEVKLTGLSPGTPYFVRVIATEPGGQTLDSGELIFEL